MELEDAVLALALIAIERTEMDKDPGAAGSTAADIWYNILYRLKKLPLDERALKIAEKVLSDENIDLSYGNEHIWENVCKVYEALLP